MDYVELTCTLRNDEGLQDILMGRLAELGFESFVENDETLQAYIQAALFDEFQLRELFAEPIFKTVPFHTSQIAERNWNAEWESNYPTVMVADRCLIRAPFHDPQPGIEFDIVIEPKMSFGTAHHETTFQMLELLLEEDVKGKSLLDMGCGTGVLAILAMMKGAKSVMAVDNDRWAYENTVENLHRNGILGQTIVLGDAAAIKSQTFQLILANINRNILLNDMHHYVDCLSEGGKLFMSGFYEADLPAIKAEALRLGMTYMGHRSRNTWVAAIFSR